MDLSKKSLQSLSCIFLTLQYLIQTKKYSYSLILAIGDSGMYMSSLVKLMYQHLGIDCPPIIKMPVCRYRSQKTYHSRDKSDWFDNSVLEETIVKQLGKERELKRILIPDDEVGVGVAIRASLDLIFHNNKNILHSKTKPKIDILAEDHGSNLADLKDEYSISMYSFNNQIPGIYHLITYHLPNSIKQQIRRVFSVRKLSDKQIMNVLMNLPTKHIINGIPVFNYSLNQEVKNKIANFDLLHKQYVQFIRQLIEESMHNQLFSTSVVEKYLNNNKINTWKIMNLIENIKKHISC